jgi:hypothetical protein
MQEPASGQAECHPARHDPAADVIALMRKKGAARIEHPGGTLLAHLQRVSALLADWGARPALRHAGLCHAFYSTDGFATALLGLDRRHELVEAIGVEAEALVYLYASCARQATYPTLTDAGGMFHDRFTGRRFTLTPGQRRDFAELTAANELDIVQVSQQFRAQHGAQLLELLTGLRPLLSHAAWRHTRTVLS